MSGHNPCYMCEKRHIGCHSECDTFMDWQCIDRARKERIRQGRKHDVLSKALLKQGYDARRKKIGLG